MSGEHRFDVLRDSKDLYGSIYHIVCQLAAYHIANQPVNAMNALRLAQIAAKVLPHLPSPTEDANVW